MWERNPAIAEKAAKELYFQFLHPKQICLITGVPEQQFRNWVYNLEWKNERDELIENDLKKVKKTALKYTEALKGICRDSVEIIREQIRAIRYKNEELSLADLKTISAILGDIDRLTRLEDGKPTSILMTSLNQSDVIDLIKQIQDVDQYVDYIEIQAETLDGSSDSTTLAIGNREEPSVLEGLPAETRSSEQALAAAQFAEKDFESDF